MKLRVLLEECSFNDQVFYYILSDNAIEHIYETKGTMRRMLI